METGLASRVYNFIFDCKRGEIELQDLIQTYSSPMEGFTEAKATEILSSSEQQDPETKQKKKTFAIGVNSEGRKTVRISCKARICFSYVSKGRCSQRGKCKNLHICRGFLEDNCDDANTCSRSHNLLDNGNKNKLQKLDSRIVEKQNSSIRNVISKNLPFVCKNYLKNECRNESCQNLHICSRYVRDVCCSEEDACPLKLSHDLTSSHNEKIFKKYQVPENYRKCNTLLPKGTKVEKFINGEKGRRSKTTSMNNLDTDDDSKQHDVKPKLMEFTQNISSSSHCLPMSGDELRQNCSKLLQNKNTEETAWSLHGDHTNPMMASSFPRHPQTDSNLQKWVSVGCFEKPPSESLPTCTSDGQNVLRPSCSVPRGLGGKEASKKVGMASGMSNGAQAKPVSWAGRGRGRLLPGQDVLSTSSQKYVISELNELEGEKIAVKKSLYG